jgi:pimeloyl-ACP methyl ester carboxylesterase
MLRMVPLPWKSRGGEKSVPLPHRVPRATLLHQSRPTNLNTGSTFSINPGSAAEEPPARGATAAHRGRWGLGRFTASDGAEIFYAEEGEGRPVLLLHGLMAHAGFFERQQPLSEGLRLIAVDLRGHGRSPSEREAPTLDVLARDITELADALELEGAIGVGWSLGAAVLWRVLAGPASRRFAGAVVVDMTPRVANAADWDLGLTPEMCDARTQAIAADFPTFAASAGAAIFSRSGEGGSGHPLAGWAAEEFARNDPQAIGATWASLVEEDFRPALGTIRQPTLVVHGAHSHLYGPETAAHLVAALPNARGVMFEDSGHAPHLEQPELFNRILKEFAASLPPVLHRTTQAQTA